MVFELLVRNNQTGVFDWSGKLFGYKADSVWTQDEEELFKRGLALETMTSILARVWEEIGFRCLFIFTAMIGVWFVNLIWGQVETVKTEGA